jgi:phenylacetate-coenzyme A ligase PaaK-like adenylate-forming protein
MSVNKLKSTIFSISDKQEFDSLACRIFKFQYNTNKVYKGYVDLLNKNPHHITKINDIPFIPISFYKNNMIISGELNHQLVFNSSGTTGANPSKHFVVDVALYKKSFINAFTLFYGNPLDYCFLALLPGYIERQGSSLIYMVNELMKISGHPDNGFFLNEFDLLKEIIKRLKQNSQKYILIGVTYVLLDFAEVCSIDLSDGIVMETGGMKGTRKEMVKTEVHQILKERFNVEQIHSEYGMTELLTQAYSKGDGLYTCPPWMKVMIRDVYDPFGYVAEGNSGGINIIDLANIYSCSFIETKDLGRKNKSGEFEILGRFDDSDIRGCNLLIT